MLLEKIASKSEIFSRRERVGVKKKKKKAKNEFCRVTKLINIKKKLINCSW